jgi:hypothetical protein
MMMHPFDPFLSPFFLPFFDALSDPDAISGTPWPI